MKTNRPTTSDVAARAGVSQSSVSMILSNPDTSRFSQETVRRVLTTAEELGYRHRPRAAKAPCSFHEKTVLVICPVISNPYYSSLVQAIEQEAAQIDFSAVVCNTYRSIRREQKILSAFLNSNISGIIFTFVPQSREMVEEINRKIPVVVIGDRNTSVNADTVEIDSILSGSLVAEHLLELGHHAAAFISTTLNEKNAVRVNRLNGLRRTFQRQDPRNTVSVFSEAVTSDEDLHDPMIEQTIGFRLAQKAIQDKKITALVAVNDMVAYGVIAAVQQAGRSIPRDYSVCGFDNIFPSQFPAVSLTAVEHYIMEKGRNAVDILAERTRSDREGPVQITRLEYRPRLIVRKSTGRAKTA